LGHSYRYNFLFVSSTNAQAHGNNPTFAVGMLGFGASNNEPKKSDSTAAKFLSGVQKAFSFVKGKVEEISVWEVRSKEDQSYVSPWAGSNDGQFTFRATPKGLEAPSSPWIVALSERYKVSPWGQFFHSAGIRAGWTPHRGRDPEDPFCERKERFRFMTPSRLRRLWVSEEIFRHHDKICSSFYCLVGFHRNLQC